MPVLIWASQPVRAAVQYWAVAWPLVVGSPPTALTEPGTYCTPAGTGEIEAKFEAYWTPALPRLEPFSTGMTEVPGIWL